MKSIRANLVVWLVSALALGSVLLLVGTYTFVHEEVGRMFDEELKQIAYAVHLREDWTEERAIRIAKPEFVFAVRAYEPDGRVFFETWLPTLRFDGPQARREGFADVHTASGVWRVFTHVTPEGIVQVAQPADVRAALARSLSFRMLLPVVLFIPALAVLIGWVLRRALAPLNDTSQGVARRDATRLEPLSTEGVPSELVPLIDQINALMTRLAASLASQRRFVADAAHELRSPVAALALQAQLAERAGDAEGRAAAFADLQHAITRARRLVQQLLVLARLEPGESPEPTAPVDLAALAREVVGNAAIEADANDIDLGADAPEPAFVTGGREALRSLLANLVDNALRYAPRGTEVTVGVRPGAAAVELTVVDHGPGVSATDRERVFERFHRIAGDATQGSGLGLAIAKAVVEVHRGSIILEDAGDDADRPGLLVRVRLPASAATKDDATASQPRKAVAAVDDDRRTRQIGARVGSQE
jgi:two-component system OmpR family sensor kinase